MNTAFVHPEGMEEALRVAVSCRVEMRQWAKWWRRGSRGAESPAFVLRGAVRMRNAALAMERQAERLKGGAS